MTKRLIRLLFCAGLLLGLLTVTALAADWKYNATDQTLTSGSGENAVTLSNVTDDGANGLVIGENKNFSGTLDLTGTITDGGTETYTITSIGYQAFRWCSNLTSVDLSGCTGLTSIGENAFVGCSNLTRVDLSGCTGLTSIESYVFSDCSKLTDLNLPASLTTIGVGAFAYCSSLTSLNLSASLTTIGIGAFSNCTALTSLNLPASLTTIGLEAFNGCSSLREFTVAEGNKYFSAVDNVLFNKDKTNLICYPAGRTDSSYTVPDGVTSIGNYAFDGRTGLTSVVLPDSVTEIGDKAFRDCTGLTSVVLPDSVTEIRQYTFQGCTGLTSVVLPDSVTEIRQYAFSGCTGLTSVVLPDSVTEIGDRAFRDCTGLTELVVLAQTPPTLGGSNALSRGASGPPSIMVPKEYVETYKGCIYYWSSYADYIQALSYDLTVTPDSSSLELLQGAAPTAVTFTVTNSSNVTVPGLEVTLSDSGGNFELDTSGMAASLAPSDKTTFTVTPKSGLAPGTYKTTVQVTSRISDQPVTAELTCTVKAVGIAAAPNTLDFGSAERGGARPAARTVTVTSPDVPVTLEQPTSSSYYDVTMTSGSLSLSAGESVTFSIQPKEGLAAGAYTETLTITGSTNAGNVPVSAAVELTYSVYLPTYTVTVNASEGGTATGGGAYTEGNTVTLTATASEGWHFVAWVEDGQTVSSDNPYTITACRSCTLTARFEKDPIPVTGVTLDRETLSLTVGGSAVLTATVAPDDADNKTVTWSSSDETVATVDNGTVTAVSAGTAAITAAAADGSGKTAACAVTVTRPSSGGGSSGGSTPTRTPSQQAIDKIKAAKEGSTVEITLKSGQTKLDKEVFQALAGRDVTLEISLPGGVSWTVNGQDIPTDAALTDLDMGVSMDTGTIPVDVINAVTGEVGTLQLTLAHDGAFGFTLTLTAPLGKTSAGYWANLYWYNEDAGAMEFQFADQIAADGTARFPFSHASQYAIVIDTESHEPQPEPEPLPFTDVAEDAWYGEAVRYVYESGLMTGVSDTAFAPHTTTSRAMVVTILARYEGVDTDAGSTWYETGAAWAVENGVSDGTNLEQTVTREQLVTMLWRYAGSPIRSTPMDGFSDYQNISLWAADAMTWAVGKGILQGNEAGAILPQGSASRAEVAAILARFVAATV